MIEIFVRKERPFSYLLPKIYRLNSHFTINTIYFVLLNNYDSKMKRIICNFWAINNRIYKFKFEFANFHLLIHIIGIISPQLGRFLHYPINTNTQNLKIFFYTPDDSTNSNKVIFYSVWKLLLNCNYLSELFVNN